MSGNENADRKPQPQASAGVLALGRHAQGAIRRRGAALLVWRSYQPATRRPIFQYHKLRYNPVARQLHDPSCRLQMRGTARDRTEDCRRAGSRKMAFKLLNSQNGSTAIDRSRASATIRISCWHMMRASGGWGRWCCIRHNRTRSAAPLYGRRCLASAPARLGRSAWLRI
jgi:hypothetical protein